MATVTSTAELVAVESPADALDGDIGPPGSPALGSPPSGSATSVRTPQRRMPNAKKLPPPSPSGMVRNQDARVALPARVRPTLPPRPLDGNMHTTAGGAYSC